MTKFNLILTFLLSFNAFAEFTTAEEAELKQKVYRTELFLKGAIDRDLAKMLGPQALTQVSITVDQKALYSHLGGLDDKWEEVKAMELPGLFMNPGQGESLKEVKKVSQDDIFSFITTLKVDVVVTDKSLNLDKVKLLVDKIVRANYAQSKTTLEINTFYNAPVIDPVVGQFHQHLMNAVPYIIAGLILSLFLLAGFYFISLNFQKSMTELKEVIGNKDMSGSIPLSNDMYNMEEQKELSAASQGIEMNHMDRYYELIEKMDQYNSTHQDVIKQMINFNFHLKDYQKLMVLMEVIPADRREAVYADLPKHLIEEFKSFLIFHGDELYTTGDKLLHSAKHVLKLLSLSSINAENFYSYYLKEMTQELSVPEMSQVASVLKPSEFMYFSKFVDTSKLAMMMSHGEFDFTLLQKNHQPLKMAEIKNCVDTISKRLFDFRESVEPNRLAEIIHYLPSEQEERVLEQMGMDTTQSFKQIITKNFEEVVSFVKEQPHRHQISILALFDESTRATIIKRMPELMAERLNLETFKITHHSLEFKAELVRKFSEPHDEANLELIKQAS